MVFYGIAPPSQSGILWEDGGNMMLHLGEKKFLRKTLLAAAAILGMLAFAGTPQASAEDYGDCQRRISRADHKLHEAVDHHGSDSPQAAPSPHDSPAPPEHSC